MNAKLRYRLLSTLVALCMVLVLFPAVALAAEDPVAQIGDTTYATLDEAVETAEEGATIELLQDCELTKGFNKTLTFTGTGKITIHKQLTSNGEGWMCFGLSDPTRVLTFDGSGVEVEWNSEVGTSPWLMLSLSGTLNVTNGAKVTFTVDSGSTGSRNAIYMNAGSSINVTNGSTFIINGYGTAGKEGQGLQLDKTGTASVNVTGNSTFIINGTNRGYVNSPTIYVENSTFTVQNCTANASNGGNFTAINSKINYLHNSGHGLSAGDVIIKNSEFTAENNGYYGVYATAAFLVDSTSTVTVTKNSWAGDYAGLKLTSGVTSGLVEAGAVVTITGNYCSGLSNNGKVVFEEGAKLTIMNNVNDKGTTSNGGGVYNSGSSANLTLPSDAVIYNNHADSAGDDIFSNTTSTIIFGKVGADWVLDDCNQMIDGWYDDSNGTRWEAHAETEEGNHIAEFTNFDEETGLATVTGLTALKAAHGAEGKDKTSYPGLDKVIVTEGEDGMLVDAKEDTAAAGGTVNFKLTTNVPDDLLNYINLPDVDDPSVVNVLADEPVRGSYQLVIHDQMDDELVLDPESIVVTLGVNDVLIPVDQYTVAYDVAHDDGTICDFEITLDLVNLYEMGAITDDDIANATDITVTYTATLAEDVTAGAYLNTAWVTYPEGESEKDTVKVKTYGIDIFKYDQALGVDGENAGLAGAEFALYGADDVTVAEEDGTVTVNPDADPILTVTSGEDGDVVINGLDKGVYYLMETKAPEGYVQSTTPLKVTIPDDADETTYLVEVNFANAQVPHTGGAGTLMYTVGGAAIILLAGALLLISRYSRKKQVG